MDNLVSTAPSAPEHAADGGGPADASPSVAPQTAPLVATALAQGADAYAVASPDGTLIFVNAAMLVAAGLDARGPRPTDLFSLLDAFRAEEFEDPAGDLRATLGAGRVFEREVSCPERGRSYALRVSPVTRGAAAGRDNSGDGDSVKADDSGGDRADECAHAELLGYAFAVRDVTRLREAERLRGAMLSLVSHELRTPLTSISGFAELLAEDETLPGEAREFVSIILGESQRLTRMVNAFLTGARTGQDEVHDGLLLAPLSLDEVAREAAGRLRRTALESGVLLVYEDSPRLPPVVGDGALIARAVEALLADALARSTAGATITVSTSHEADSVLLVVETGPVQAAAGADAASPDDLAHAAEAAERHGGCLLRETLPAGTRLVFTLPRP